MDKNRRSKTKKNKFLSTRALTLFLFLFLGGGAEVIGENWDPGLNVTKKGLHRESSGVWRASKSELKMHFYDKAKHLPVTFHWTAYSTEVPSFIHTYFIAGLPRRLMGYVGG